MRDYFDIIRRNLFSPIVIAIFLLAGALLYVRQYRDAWFISVVIVVNSCIGIVQEVRAKRILKKLELMSAPKARLLKDGAVIEVAFDSLHVGDTIELQAGDEIPADGTILSSKGLEVNESLLTGESAAIDKKNDDIVYAATVVNAGTADVRITAVGNDTKAGSISATLKRYSAQQTPLQRSIQQAITFLTYMAVVLAAVIFVAYYFSGQDAVSILRTITASAITVVPEGLLLASSLLLAFGSLRLTQAEVLPQKLSAIEAMALLGVLCVDKTGTLTSDEVTLEKCVAFDEKSSIGPLAALIAKETSGGNMTGQAILASEKPQKASVVDILAFSSVRKFAGIQIAKNNKKSIAIMGAPEFVTKYAPLSEKQQRQIDEWTNQGLRVLLVACFDNASGSIKKLQKGTGQPVGAVILRNSLRSGVKDTVKFLQGQGVAIRVISGDNPQTVRYIARSAGIAHPDSAMTGAELEKLDDIAFGKAADTHTIFARVLPEQKERLIAHFKNAGNFTGMVGDGVNDALALKKADLGVAMYAGAPASRRVADIVLLNNSFTSLPVGMRLGNRIMQAIEVIATLFFHKIIYGVVLLGATLLLGVVYPFAPRHITFMNVFLVTMPTIMWTLFPPRPRHRINPRHFWHDTLGGVAPIALVTGFTTALMYWLMRQAYPISPELVSTMTVIIATFFGVYLVFLVGPMLGVVLDKKAKLARLLYLLSVATVVLLSFGVGPLRDFFDFTRPDFIILWPSIGIVGLAALLQWQLAKYAGAQFSRRQKR